ncbi:hypothetical protein [Thermosediminibacter litoriperuensis]|uniref:Deoxyhypusine synthase n=1 Tax=Thermosediminibacter litoriperuensis TaxID=291989 RepID=A0A5S5AG15_9FIRM|nr:hypothetical protein [Thermosediminibacter litoriperuensis]TYP48722.1 hypothetical protein LZ11_02248 [Thermosediminibacter litoriperuensis]
MGEISKNNPAKLSLDKVTTYHVWDRKNLVTVDDLLKPGIDPAPEYENPELDELAGRIVRAREKGRPVIWSMGAHVIKCGLSMYVIELINRGVITHVASNGAGSIHDFELAYLGGTSEYVPRAIEDGTFGMWEETGRWMNEAIKEGYRQGLGYGQSLAVFVEKNKDRFPYRDYCIFYNAYKKGVPATYHVTIGTDIIDQHPSADFAAKGYTSGNDFLIFCHSVSQLEGGVYLNFGSSVTAPEVFLKALSISRNLGYTVKDITTANFDIIPLGDYRKEVGQDHFHYYYRPRKNIVNRPTSLGGRGFYIEGNHKATIPNLYNKIMKRLNREV